MRIFLISRKLYATFFICACIVLCWLLIAFHSGQSLYETQRGQMLLGYGAVNGKLLAGGSHWRIIVSQFLHVRFAHMLANVLFIFLIGSYVEKRFGSFIFLLVFFLGGSIGQYASVLCNPTLVSSGASQALCGLAGFSTINLSKDWRSYKIAMIVVLLFVLIQCSLDLYFAKRLKEGHILGFLAGGVMSIYFVWKAIRKKQENRKID
jgi:rhomboid protease GluP